MKVIVKKKYTNTYLDYVYSDGSHHRVEKEEMHYQEIKLTGRWKVVVTNKDCTLFLEHEWDYQKEVKTKVRKGYWGFWIFKEPRYYVNTTYETERATEFVPEQDISYTIEYDIQECSDATAKIS